MNLATCVLYLALRASAHEGYPIAPVRAALRVEPDRIAADLRVDSIFWIEEVTSLHPMPASNWPADARARVEAYVNAHFKLSAGGKPLSGKLVSARYRQWPWEVNEQGVFFLRMEYPPLPAGEALAGTASFYEEYRREMAAEYRGRRFPYASDYQTFVDIPGRKHLRFTLTADAPSFSAPDGEARRPASAMAFEGLARGVGAALGAAAAFPALLGLGLWLFSRWPEGGAKPAAAGAAVAAAASAYGLWLPAPAWGPWAAALAAALAAGIRPGLPQTLAAGAAFCGIAETWGAAAATQLPHGPGAALAAVAGALAGGALLLALVLLAARAEHARLRALSESRVEELFARRARLIATALAMVGAYGLWRSLPM
jgi:hypothetical protein